MKNALLIGILSTVHTSGRFHGVALVQELDRALGVYVGRAYNVPADRAAWFYDRPDHFTVLDSDGHPITQADLAQRLAQLDAQAQLDGGQGQDGPQGTEQAQGAALTTAATTQGRRQRGKPTPEAPTQPAPAQEGQEAPGQPAPGPDAQADAGKPATANASAATPTSAAELAGRGGPPAPHFLAEQ